MNPQNIYTDELFDKAAMAYQNGDIQLSLSLWEKLKIELIKLGGGELVNPPYTGDLISALMNIGNLYSLLFKFNDAENSLLDAEKLCSGVLDYYQITTENINQHPYGKINIHRFCAIQQNLGMLKANLKEWDDAELRFRNAENCYEWLMESGGCDFADINDLFISVLQIQATMYADRRMWDKACVYFEKALKTYLSASNIERNYIGISANLFDILIGLGYAYANRGQLDDAELVYKKADLEAHALSIYHIGTLNYINIKRLILLFNNQGFLYIRIGNIKDAIESYKKIDNLAEKLSINDTNAISLFPIIVSSKISKGALLCDINHLSESINSLNNALIIIEDLKYFPSTYIDDLIRISGIYCNGVFTSEYDNSLLEKLTYNDDKTGSTTLDIIDVFNRISKLLLCWLELQTAEIPPAYLDALEKFWQEWILAAINRRSPVMLANILCASHARRQVALLNANWSVAKNLSPRIRQFVELKKQLHTLEVQLLPMEQAFSHKNDPQYNALLGKHRQLHEEWLRCRTQLIAKGDYSDTYACLNINEMLLAKNEMLLLCMSMKEFGFQESTPYLLLVYENRIDCVWSPQLEAVAKTMQIIQEFQSTSVVRRHSGLRKNTTEFTEDDIAESNADALSAKFDQIQIEMKVFWKSLNLKNICALHIIGHGTMLHALPWQYDCPVAINHFYPGLYVYYQRQKNLHSEIPIPSDKYPLFLLVNASEDKLLNRLYFLVVEIAAIMEIWNASNIRVINDLKGFESGHLALLGHGNFDRKTGQARFMMKDRKLDASEILSTYE